MTRAAQGQSAAVVTFTVPHALRFTDAFEEQVTWLCVHAGRCTLDCRYGCKILPTCRAVTDSFHGVSWMVGMLDKVCKGVWRVARRGEGTPLKREQGRPKRGEEAVPDKARAVKKQSLRVAQEPPITLLGIRRGRLVASPARTSVSTAPICPKRGNVTSSR